MAAEALRNRRAEILICDPAGREDACARETLAALALRVYRRPATDSELEDLLEVMELAETEGGGFEGGVEVALHAMLVSPPFLFRGIPPEGQATRAGDVVRLDGFALATRLSPEPVRPAGEIAAAPAL